MKIGGLIIGTGIGQIVRDGRTLNAMEKAGHFIRPERLQPYVDSEKRIFEWNGHQYECRYFDGCFFQFVVKIS